MESELATLLRSELNLQREIHLLRVDLRACPDFSAANCFRDIAGSDTHLYAEDLYALYRREGRTLLASDEQAIMRRLDQDGDGKLSFSEFYDAVNVTRPLLRSPPPVSSSQRSISPARRSPPISHARPLLYSSPHSRVSMSPPPRRAYHHYDSPPVQREYSPLRGQLAVIRQHPYVERELLSRPINISSPSSYASPAYRADPELSQLEQPSRKEPIKVEDQRP